MAQDEKIEHTLKCKLLEVVKEIQNGMKVSTPYPLEFIGDLLNRMNSEWMLAESDNLLRFVAKYSNIPATKFLINSRDKPDFEDVSGMTVLINAAMDVTEDSCHVTFIRLLYKANVRVIAQTLFGGSDPPKSCEGQAHFIVTRRVLSKLKDRGVDLARCGEILARIACPHDTIVRFHNRPLTQAYLQTFPPYDFLDNDPDDHLLRIVMKSADWRHLDIVIRHFRHTSLVSRKLFQLLMEFIPRYHSSKAGRDFLRGFLRLDIFDEQSVYQLEIVLMDSSTESIEIFLRYDFRSSIKAQCGIDILPCLFGNPKVDAISLLKNRKIDVDSRGSHHRTALHFAAYRDATRNIQSLLDRGADVYALNRIKGTPAYAVMAGRGLDRYEENEVSVKLFLLAGADPLESVKIREHDGWHFFGIDQHAKPKSLNVIRLLAAHLAICEANGRSIERHMQGFYWYDDPQLETYFEDCRRQLKRMRSHEIGNTHFRKLTMFTIVSERAEKTFRYIGEEERLTIDRHMAEYREVTILPYYYEALERNIANIEEIKLCRNKAMDVISECIGIHVQHLVVDSIVSFLSTKDLLLFK